MDNRGLPEQCKFTALPCQRECWAANFVDEGGTPYDGCYAFELLPDGEQPRDWYNRCMNELYYGA